VQRELSLSGSDNNWYQSLTTAIHCLSALLTFIAQILDIR
jgi:hypothetical protein